MSLIDLQKTKDKLAAIDKEIEEEREKFEATVAERKEQRAKLEAELEEGLRTELASITSAAQKVTTEPRRRSKIDDAKIIAALRKQPGSGAAYIFDQIEGRTLGISSQSLSIKLAKLVEDGVLVKEGERRGTRYSVAP